MRIANNPVTVSVIILLITVSCRIFEPRKSEPPLSQAEWNHFPILPGQTLDNLYYAYSYAENREKYREILGEGFRFFFDSQDVQTFNLPVFWEKEDEILVRTLMTKVFSDISFTPMSENDDVLLGESAVYYRNYSINYDGVSYQGKMTINIVRENDGFWKIKDWYDYRESGIVNTWGRLKYENYSQ